MAADRATTSNIRLLDPTIVSPAFTQFQQGKNFYYFPDQLSIDRYNGPDGNLRDYVVAARELNPDRLIDNQRDWINRHTVYTHGNGFIASPANTVRGVANDPNQNGGYPEFLASVVGANGSVVSPGPAPLDQPRVYFGPVIAGTSDDYAIVGKSGADREYDYETNTETKNYTYSGKGGVPIGNWLNRSRVRREVRRAELPVLQPDRAGQQDPVQPGPVRAGEGGGAVADHRHQRVPGDRQQADGVDRRRLHHAGQLPVLGADVAVERHRRLHRGGVQPAGAGQAGVLHPQLGEGHGRRLRRHGDAVRTGRIGSGAAGVDEGLPRYGQAEERHHARAAEHLRYPEDLFKVQRALLAKYHVNDPVTFFSTSDFWDVPQDPNPTASSYQPPYYIVAKDLAKNDNSASFQLTSAMNRFQRDFLAAYISASSDPDTYGKITVLTIPGQVNGPKLANNAITTDTAVSQDLGVIGRDNQNRIRWGNLLTLPVAEGGLLYVEPVYASPGASDAASSYPRLIRVAMMYEDRVGYGPTVRDALTELFGPGADATATGPAPANPASGRPAATPQADGQPAAQPGNQEGTPPEVPTPIAAVPRPGGPTQLSPAKAAALQDVQSALGELRTAQQSGDFAEFGTALQRLDDAMQKYDTAK